MSYVVGISSGWYKIGKDPNLLGFGPKIGSFAATVGAQFNQVDIDTVLEFIEPDIISYVNTVKEKLSMDVGLHGEIGEYAAFESAEKIIWDQSHSRMIQTMVGASKIKFKYVNWHLSSTLQLNRREREIRPFGHTYQVVSPEGTSFGEWVIDNINEPGAKMLKEFMFRDDNLFDNQILGSILNEKSKQIENEVEEITKDLKNIVNEKSKKIKIIIKEINELLRRENLDSDRINLDRDRDSNQWVENFNSNSKNIEFLKENLEINEERLRELNSALSEIFKINVPKEFKILDKYKIQNEDGEIINLFPSGLLEAKTNEFYEYYLNLWKDTAFTKYILPNGEIDAYLFVGIYMIGNNDPLWEKIVGRKYMTGPGDSLKAYVEKPVQFNAAVAAKYLQKHFGMKNILHKNHPMNEKSIVDFCEEKDIKLLFECPQSGEGVEGLSRFFHPIHSYHFVKSMNSPAVMQCIDFEQEMGQGTDLDFLFDDSKKDDIKTEPLPADFGSNVYLLHLGTPIPYFGTAHIPIALAERGSDAIYRWIYNLRMRGYKDGIIIFERGAGRGSGQNHFQIFEYAIFMLRQMVKYLNKDVAPKDLPPEFFGMDEKNKEIYSRQLILIREHAWDPLEGLLKIPEEKHTFLGNNAVESGKAQQWDKAKYR